MAHNSLLRYDIRMKSRTDLEDTLDSFCHEIFVFMESQGRGLTNYFSITRECSIFAIY